MEFRLQGLEGFKEYLADRIVGQPNAVESIANSILRAELGLKRNCRPKSGMLLLGPTGVGKTEVVLALSEYLYGDRGRVKRFDMAEYQRQESLNWLLGGGKSEQGVLGDAIDDLNEKGGGVVLFDEIEKAHQSMNTIFLSALDAGRISMSNGETKDLSQCYLFFTSNLGASNAAKMLQSNYVTVKACMENAARNYFSPELFARFEEIVVFSRLGYDSQVGICQNMLKSELEHLESVLKTPLNATDEVLNFLIQKGFTRDLGARIMRKTIEKEIGNALVSWKMSTQVLKKKSPLTINVENLKLKIA